MIGAATATMLDVALDYARRRWRVFPLHGITEEREHFPKAARR